MKNNIKFLTTYMGLALVWMFIFKLELTHDVSMIFLGSSIVVALSNNK